MRLSRPGPSTRRVVSAAVVTLVVVYLGVGALIWHSMNQPPEVFGRVMSRMPGPVVFLLYPFESLWMRARAGGLEVGDLAPDFSLQTIDRSRTVQLSALTRLQPVVLVFGSYT